MAYSKQLNDRFESVFLANPDTAKPVKKFLKDDKTIGTGLVGAPACGDVMRVSLKINENGIIEDSDFKIFGCGAAVASASLAAELVKNRTLEEALLITNEHISKELSLPPVKRHCSLLAEQAIRRAVEDYKHKNQA